MKQLLPGSAATPDVTVDAVYGELFQSAAAAQGAPYVVLNMVESADGAISLDGLSGGLSSTADKAVFSYLRSLADIILVGASTVRDENYGQPTLKAERVAERMARGQQPLPRIAVVSKSLELNWDGRLFTETPDADPQPQRPIVICPADADPGKLQRAKGLAEVMAIGTGMVDVRAALHELSSSGARLVLCEGGPELNGQLLSNGLADELCLTVSPALVGGMGRRLSGSAEQHEAIPLDLLTVAEADGMLLLRYRVGQSASNR